MKLFEIINLKTKKIYNSQKSKKEYERQLKSTKKGVFSWVEDDKDDPFLVNKKHRVDSENPETGDGFYVYLNNIKHKMAENPFFPRVYEAEKHYQKDAKSNSRVNSKMEKLFPLKDLSISLQDAMVKSLFDVPRLLEEIKKRDLQESFGVFVRAYKNSDPVAYSENMTYFLAYLKGIEYFRIPPDRVIKNNELKEALNLILSTKRSADLHSDNIMFRRTPYGPQLVLADPLSF